MTANNAMTDTTSEREGNTRIAVRITVELFEAKGNRFI